MWRVTLNEISRRVQRHLQKHTTSHELSGRKLLRGQLFMEMIGPSSGRCRGNASTEEPAIDGPTSAIWIAGICPFQRSTRRATNYQVDG
jgi:hypothetical protein